MSAELVAWLTAIWDEQEKREQEKRTWKSEAPPMDVTTSPEGDGVYVSQPGSSIQHWLSTEDYERAYLSPAPDTRVLARIAADRRILAVCLHGVTAIWHTGYTCGAEGGYDEILSLLALPYTDRPGYQAEWSL